MVKKNVKRTTLNGNNNEGHKNKGNKCQTGQNIEK